MKRIEICFPLDLLVRHLRFGTYSERVPTFSPHMILEGVFYYDSTPENPLIFDIGILEVSSGWVESSKADMALQFFLSHRRSCVFHVVALAPFHLKCSFVPVIAVE